MFATDETNIDVLEDMLVDKTEFALGYEQEVKQLEAKFAEAVV